MIPESDHPLPPRVPGLPGFGNAIAAYRDPVAFLLSQYRRRGPVFRFRAGFHEFDVLAGPEANALAHEDRGEKLRAGAFWAPIVTELGSPHAIMALDGPEHREMRRVLAPTMSRTVVERRLGAMLEIARDAFAEVDAGQRIPFVAFARRLVSTQVARLVTGRAIAPAEVDAILDVIDAAFVRFGVLRLPRWTRVFRGRRRRATRSDTRRVAARLLAEARDARAAGGGDERRYGDRTLELARRFPHLYTEGDLELAMVLPFFLGVPTMGQTLVFALWELLRRPGLLERVRTEVDAAFAQGVPSVERFRAMDDLRGLVLETLRMHPTAFGSVRRVAEPLVFADHRIEAGRDVLIFSTACHFLDEHFPEAQQFDIERYRPPRDEHRRPNVYTPFGRGPHACLGSALGETLLMADLAAIVRCVDLELVEPERAWRPILTPTPSLGPRFEVRVVGHAAR